MFYIIYLHIFANHSETPKAKFAEFFNKKMFDTTLVDDMAMTILHAVATELQKFLHIHAKRRQLSTLWGTPVTKCARRYNAHRETH